MQSPNYDVESTYLAPPQSEKKSLGLCLLDNVQNSEEEGSFPNWEVYPLVR